jgi:hypothetical protein
MENNEEKTVNENTGVANAQDDDKLIHNIELSWPFMDCIVSFCMETKNLSTTPFTVKTRTRT